MYMHKQLRNENGNINLKNLVINLVTAVNHIDTNITTIT